MAYTIYQNTGGSININSVTPVTVVSFTVPAYTGVPRGKITLTIFADIQNNSGANRTYTFTGAFGGTNFIADAAIALPTSATRRSITITFDIANNSTAAINSYRMEIDVSAISAATTGTGDFGTAETIPPTTIVNTGTINQANAQTLSVSITSDSATATQQIRPYHMIAVVN